MQSLECLVGNNHPSKEKKSEQIELSKSPMEENQKGRGHKDRNHGHDKSSRQSKGGLKYKK